MKALKTNTKLRGGLGGLVLFGLGGAGFALPLLGLTIPVVSAALPGIFVAVLGAAVGLMVGSALLMAVGRWVLPFEQAQTLILHLTIPTVSRCSWGGLRNIMDRSNVMPSDMVTLVLGDSREDPVPLDSLLSEHDDGDLMQGSIGGFIGDIEIQITRP